MHFIVSIEFHKKQTVKSFYLAVTMFNYGSSAGDKSLTDTDDGCSDVIHVPNGIQIFENRHTKIYVYIVHLKQLLWICKALFFSHIIF